MALIIRKKGLILPRPAQVVASPKPTARLLDALALAPVRDNRNLLVPWVLMASYAYYVHDQALLSDDFFDKLVQELRSGWVEIKHRHKSLITPGHLAAGSLYDLKEEDYPLLARNAAAGLLLDHLGIKIDVKVL